MTTGDADGGTLTKFPAPNTAVTTGCCPPFDPSQWQGEQVWRQKLFVRDRVHSVLHVPVDMTKKVRLNQQRIDAAGAASGRGFMLLDENSLWGADLYLEVTRPVPGARMVTLSGKFRTEVFEGPYHKTGDWAAEVQKRVAASGARVENIYFHYTTCPRCAKAYGKNYVVLFAKLAEDKGAVHPMWQPSWQPPRSERQRQSQR